MFLDSLLITFLLKRFILKDFWRLVNDLIIPWIKIISTRLSVISNKLFLHWILGLGKNRNTSNFDRSVEYSRYWAVPRQIISSSKHCEQNFLVENQNARNFWLKWSFIYLYFLNTNKNLYKIEKLAIEFEHLRKWWCWIELNSLFVWVSRYQWCQSCTLNSLNNAFVHSIP